MKLRNLLLLCSSLTLLTSCKTKLDDETITPVDKLYYDGYQLLEQKKFKKASEEFQKIYFQHPGNAKTPEAEIMEAYSLFLAHEYDEAIDVLEIFSKLHPLHRDIDYVYYLKALSYYMQISDDAHDQSRTQNAKYAFEEVIKRFPHSRFAADSALKMNLANDHLAGAEMNAGRFYLVRNNPIAASRRFETVIKDYQTTSHVPEALYRMVEVYMMLGIKEEAQKYAAVLGANYLDSYWYKEAYKLMQNTKKVKKRRK